MSIEETQTHSDADSETNDSPVAVPEPRPELPVADTERTWQLINEHADELDLPQVVTETVIDLFRQMYAQCSPAGRGLLAGVAASVRVACQIHGCLRSLCEIAAVSDSDQTPIAREATKIRWVTAEHTTPLDPTA